MTLISGYIGSNEQAAMVILTSISHNFIQPSKGIENTTCMFVGRHIGNMDVKQAKM